MGVVNFLMKEEMELSTLGAPKIDLMQEKHNLVEKEHTFTTEFKKFLGEDRKTIRKFFGNREVTDAIVVRLVFIVGIELARPVLYPQ